ncbi:outer envelope pore protein 16, chloroplastic-like [Fagus crenata]
MPRSRFSGSLSTPKVDVAIDMGNPLLNLTVDGFLKIGTVAATRVVAEDAYHVLRKGIYIFKFNLSFSWKCISRNNLEHTLKKMCKEGAYGGTVAGVYVGMEYGVERIRGTSDWKIHKTIQKLNENINTICHTGESLGGISWTCRNRYINNPF